MRIIGGNLKGKKIHLPDDKLTRPLRDLVKESIFNLIEHSNRFDVRVKNSYILDLFSGSGSFGLECISRSANLVTFVENYSKALSILKKNILHLKVDQKCKIISNDCFDFLLNNQNLAKKFEIIFLDPPYKEKRINDLLDLIIKNFLKKRGIIIIHRHKNDDIEISEKLKILDNRQYGISKIVIGTNY
tara:strand:- start:161 stop:724 length:564 start_codon:yes stop_codon:yes gene_type:complete